MIQPLTHEPEIEAPFYDKNEMSYLKDKVSIDKATDDIYGIAKEGD